MLNADSEYNDDAMQKHRLSEMYGGGWGMAMDYGWSGGLRVNGVDANINSVTHFVKYDELSELSELY